MFVKPTMSAPGGPVYEFGDFHLDAGRRLLWKAGTPVPLTSRVFDTLLYMLEHPDTVLLRNHLIRFYRKQGRNAEADALEKGAKGKAK